MAKYLGSIVLASIVVMFLGTADIKAETSSTGIIQAASSTSAQSTSSPTTTSTPADNSKSITVKPSAVAAAAGTAAAVGSVGGGASGSVSAASSVGVNSNLQAGAVQVDPNSGSANLSIPFAVPAGRDGIQPNLQLAYNSSERQLGNAGVGWNLDLGSIQISTKRGVPKYDGTDIFTMEQSGALQDLVADPTIAGLYHMEVEGAFAKIQNFTTYWLITDKKGIKYYYGNTSDSKQNDPANPSHIFRWALNKVEDLNGNYMIISYLQDNGQIYPQTISYTGNDTASLILSTYAQVNISYAAASVLGTSYISGFLSETAKRIDHITVSVGPNIQSSYNFTYLQSVSSQRDLLQSVQQFGSDGVASLPPVSFTYRNNHGSWSADQPQWHIPDGDFVTNNNDMGRRFFDFNGDGMADFVISAHDPNQPANRQWLNESFINTKTGFSKTPNWYPLVLGYFSYSDGTSYWDDGRRMVDLTGDGIPEELAATNWEPYSGTLGQYKDGYEFSYLNQTNPGWVKNTQWSLPEGYFVYGNKVDGGIRFADFNGDGLNDLSIAVDTIHWDNAPLHVVNQDVNTYLNTGSGWKQDTRWNLPAGYFYSTQQGDGGVRLADLNGDGLTDLIIAHDGIKSTYINNGSGWTEDDSWNIPDGDFSDNGVNQGRMLVDINGDGLPDLVIAQNGYHAVYLNTGHGWKQDNSFNIPDGDFVDASGHDQGREMDDLDGDGVIDLCIGKDGYKAAYLNLAGVSDILVSVANGLGASTNIQYAPSTNYNNYYPNQTGKLSFVFQVVSQITTNDGQGNSYSTNYFYQGGFFDPPTREFRGFGSVKTTDANGNYTTTSYSQDHWLKGHPLEQDTYDVKGNLYSKSINTWQTQTIVTNNVSNQISKFVYASRSDNYLYDGNSAATPKRTAQEFTYGESPQYGDITQIINDGQVDPSSGTSIDANKTSTKVTYLYNTSNWLIGLPSQSVTQNASNQTISKTSFYYDGDVVGTAIPQLGRLTSKIDWLGSTTQADPKTTYAYDGYGNLKSTTDPNGNTTSIAYDNTVHMFPVQTTNNLKQTDAMTYYGIDNVPLDNGVGLHGLWGQDRSKSDSNNQTAYSTYDVLGRPSSSISPLDSVALPTEQKSYNIQSKDMAITDTARVDNGSTVTISAVSYYDGLGRLIETKSLGPVSGQYIASGQTVYDNRGLPITKYVAHFTNNDLNTMDVIDPTVPSSQALYDPMGRIITKTNPDKTYSSATYSQWTTTTIDENGHKQMSLVDAFGHLIQKQEYTGADGRASLYPVSAFTLYATTTYTYDPKGNLISVKDAKNDVTSITYDNLGRKVAMNDPDMGKWQYGYDANNNLIWQDDAKGQVISFKYDSLNRLQNKTDLIGGPIVNLPTLTPHAATFNVNYNFDDLTQNYGIGRLGSVAYDAGSAGFVYDQVGREVSSNKNIDGATYNVTRQYDALNHLKQLQYPDGSQVAYLYNQAGQISAVADAGAVSNGSIIKTALNNPIGNDRLAWFDRALGVNNAYAATPPAPNVTQSVVITSPTNNASFITPGNITITATATASVGTITKVSFYNGLSLLATVTRSPYTFTWSNVPAGSYNLTARATQSNSATVTSSVVAITVYAPPTVSITSPVANATFTSPVNMSITATATASTGTISSVSFYNGGALLGTVAKSPYTLAWNNVGTGSYSLTAVALQSNNMTGTSKPVAITVNAPLAPTVTLTSPTNKASFTSPASITLTATATEKNATIAKVSFYNGTSLLGTVTSVPYSFTWSNVIPGTYSLTAVATDNAKATATSLAASVIVVEPAPTVSLTSNSSTFAALATVTLTATASQAYGTINRVEFYNGSTLLGSSSVPFASGTGNYVFTWNNVQAGSYNITAKAINDTNVGTVSNSVIVGVITPNVYVSAINYNANGQVTQIQYGNGAVTAYTYDPLSFRLTRIYTTNAQATIVQDLNYTYDPVGQVTAIKDNVNTSSQTFSYDALNRLTSAKNTLYGTKAYSFDVIGNITLKDGLTYSYAAAGGRTNGTAAGPHAVTSLSDGSVFKYDANGNMVSLQKGTNVTLYVYDSQNRLTNVTVGGLKVADYAYDGDGGRIKKTVYRRDLALYNDNTVATLFGNLNGSARPATAQNTTVDTTRYIGNVYEVENPSSLSASQSRQTKFIYLGSTKLAAVGSDGNVFYYHTDHLGGTNVLTDGTGAVREETEFDPFGQVIKHEKYGNDFSTIWYYFTNKPLDDETGLMFFGARYYNPMLGRFITPDTIVQAPSNPQTLNRYTYCNNNPVNLVDPTGHSWWSKLWKAISGVVGAIVGTVVGIVTGNPILGIAIYSAIASSGQGGNFFRNFGVNFASGMASYALGGALGAFSNSSIFMNIAGNALMGAGEGAVVGGITSMLLGGTFGQGAEMGAISGAIAGGVQGFTSSEQFQNWQRGGFKSGGFQTTAEIDQKVMAEIGWHDLSYSGNNRVAWNDGLNSDGSLSTNKYFPDADRAYEGVSNIGDAPGIINDTLNGAHEIMTSINDQGAINEVFRNNCFTVNETETVTVFAYNNSSSVAFLARGTSISDPNVSHLAGTTKLMPCVSGPDRC